MKRTLPWLVLLAACSRGGTTWLGTEGPSVGGSAPAALGGAAATTLGGMAGASGAAAGSTALAPRFEKPTIIAKLSNAATDDDPSVTSDLLELYFSSNRGGNEDIWVSSRETPESAWEEPTPVLELNSSFIDATPGIAPDGLTIWFETTRLAQSNDLLGTDIFASKRPSRGAAWSSPIPVDELNTPGRDSAPLPSSALLMTFSSWRAETAGDTDIYATLRLSDVEPWGPANRLAEVSSSSWDQGLLRADGAQIFVSSGRTASLLGGNFFWSARAQLGGPFFEPVPLDDLNSDADDQDIWVSEDLSYAVLASGRSGNLEIYETRRRP